MRKKQLESVMDYYSKQWCLARFADDRDKAAWFMALYQQAELEWQALTGNAQFSLFG